MSSLVCGLDVHKDSVCATGMDHGGEIVDKTKLTNDDVISYLGRYPIDKVTMESSTTSLQSIAKERLRDTCLASEEDSAHRLVTHQDRSS